MGDHRLAVAVATAGCSERAERPEDATAAINFTTPALAVRGTATTSPAQLAAEGGFDVWAYIHTGVWNSTAASAKTSLLEEVSVTSTDNAATWTYRNGNTVEWPTNSDYVSFFAYGPAGAVTAISSDTHGTPLITYTVDDDPADQIDLLIAADKTNQKGYEYTLSGAKVGMGFKHALSQIKFSASYASERMTPPETAPVVKLTNLALKNVYNTGTVPMTSPIVWTADTGTATDYAFSIVDNTLEDIELDGTQQNVIPADIGFLFLIPQPTVGRTGGDMEIEVTFDIEGSLFSYTSPIVMPAAGWLPGKSYDYQIALTDDVLKIIVIDNDLSLDPWSTSIVLQTVVLSSEAAHDLANLNGALTLLNYISDLGSGSTYKWFGIYGVNDVNHNITIDIGALNLNTFSPGQHLIFDFKKTVRTWGDDGTNPYTLSVPIYPGWSLAAAKQTFDTGNDYYILMPDPNNPSQNIQVDGVTSATLPRELYRKSDDGVERVIQPTDAISAKGSIILVKD